MTTTPTCSYMPEDDDEVSDTLEEAAAGFARLLRRVCPSVDEEEALDLARSMIRKEFQRRLKEQLT